VTRPPGVVTSPWVYQASDYKDHVIRITVTFDNTTKVLTGATAFRDATCVYTKIYIGLGTDKSPDSTPHRIAVPAGTTTVSAAQLSAVGLSTINDIIALQITAGP
jgi:hypothetical protein